MNSVTPGSGITRLGGGDRAPAPAPGPAPGPAPRPPALVGELVAQELPVDGEGVRRLPGHVERVAADVVRHGNGGAAARSLPQRHHVVGLRAGRAPSLRISPCCCRYIPP